MIQAGSTYEAITDPGAPPDFAEPSWLRRRRALLAGGALTTCAVALFMLWPTGGAKAGVPASVARMPAAAELALSHAVPEIEFPYPSEASLTAIVLCNYDTKDWWFFPEKSVAGAATRLVPVVLGKGCASIPLSGACSDKACWRRGHLSPCANGACFSRQVTAGVNLVSSGVDGGAVCSVRCPLSKLNCEASTVAFISPAQCQQVSVLPHTATPPTLFPAPYSAIPSIAFPYPKGVVSSSVVICNYSGERFWYAWDDSTEAKWTDGPGHALVPPIEPGRPCQAVETAVSWHRGFIAPCPKSDKTCFHTNVRTVTAGVNVIHQPSGGQAACLVHCDAPVDTCRTAAVVVISPSRCERVRVTAG